MSRQKNQQLAGGERKNYFFAPAMLAKLQHVKEMFGAESETQAIRYALSLVSEIGHLISDKNVELHLKYPNGRDYEMLVPELELLRRKQHENARNIDQGATKELPRL